MCLKVSRAAAKGKWPVRNVAYVQGRFVAGGEEPQAQSGRRCPRLIAGVSTGVGEESHGPRLTKAQ